MIALLWVLLGSASAGTWAGVPLETLAPLGLGAPTLDTTEDAWQAPLSGGGFARVVVHPDASTAAADFKVQSLAVASRPLSPFIGTRYWGAVDKAVGDGAAILLLRTKNVLLLVRDPGLSSQSIAKTLYDALQPPGQPVVTHAEAIINGKPMVWDQYGRRRLPPE